MHHWRRRGSLARRSRRDPQYYPGGPALRSVLDIKVLIALQVESTLISLANWKNDSELWTDAEHTAFERPELRSRTGVGSELLKIVASHTGKKALTQKLRSCPIDMTAKLPNRYERRFRFGTGCQDS